ncbi:hypothetical protein QTP86_033753 [Hemibagrus guttatus]|nr:hypothetical protein QTP86_033753 [Hemibagrus guttatus]
MRPSFPKQQVLWNLPSMQNIVHMKHGPRKDSQCTSNRIVSSQDAVMSERIEGLLVWSDLTEELLKHKLLKMLMLAMKLNVSEHTVSHSLLCMRLRSCRLVRVPMLTPVHYQNRLQCVCAH